MRSFYSFPGAARLALGAFIVLCAILAALAFVLHQSRFKRDFSYWLNGAAALFALCQTLLCAAMFAQLQRSVFIGFIMAGDYVFLRYALFLATEVAFLCLCFKKKPLPCGFALAASILNLPIVEMRAGRAFPLFFFASLLILFFCAAFISLKIYRELSSQISRLSIKQAIDSLDTAILFYKKSGQILLQNEKMRELMVKMAGCVFYNGKIYFEEVLAKSEPCDDGSRLYRTSEGAWLFVKKEMRIRKNPVTLLTAADVTQLDYANSLLQEKNNELEARQMELKSFIENIEETCHSEELLKLKTETHDTIGQRLTLLLRCLRQGELPDKLSLSSILSDLADLSDLQRGPDETKAMPNPQAELDSLVESYRYAGVDISLNAALPPDKKISAALVLILREAAANAVIHGHADKVFAWLMCDKENCTMRITDNSAKITTVIKEGGGIFGMRRQLEKLGGKLFIDTAARFALIVTVPLQENEIQEEKQL